MTPYDQLPRPRHAPITPAERRAGHLALLALAGFFLAVALGCLVSCTTANPAPAEGPRSRGPVPTTGSANDRANDRAKGTAKPAALARLTDAIGISTPAGRAARQHRRDVAATVPRKVKVGKGGQYAPLATNALNTGNKGGAIASADSGATAQVATNATAIHGDGNKVEQTATPPAPKAGFLAGIKTFFTGLVHWLPWLLLALLVLAVVFRRRLPVIGPFFT